MITLQGYGAQQCHILETLAMISKTAASSLNPSIVLYIGAIKATFIEVEYVQILLQGSDNDLSKSLSLKDVYGIVHLICYLSNSYPSVAQGSYFFPESW